MKSSLITNALAGQSGYLHSDIPACGYLVLRLLCCLHAEFAKILKQNHSIIFLSHFLLCKLQKTTKSNANTKANTVEEDNSGSREHQTSWMREAWKNQSQPRFLAGWVSFLQVLLRLAAGSDFVGWHKPWGLLCIPRNGCLFCFLQSSALSQHHAVGKQLGPLRNIPVCTHAAYCFFRCLFHSAFKKFCRAELALEEKSNSPLPSPFQKFQSDSEYSSQTEVNIQPSSWLPPMQPL